MRDRSAITLRTYRVTAAGERRDLAPEREFPGTVPADTPLFRNSHRWAPCECPQHRA
jgi:hypothetical protein